MKTRPALVWSMLIFVWSTLLLALPARALLISELLYDAVGSDDGQVFVELWAPPGTSLSGLALEALNGDGGAVTARAALSGTVDATGFFVLGDIRADGSSDVLSRDLGLDFDVQNGPDGVRLVREEEVLDALAFGDFGDGEIAGGEGSPAPDAPAGASLARRFANLDRDDNSLDFVVLDVPTPGSGTLSAVPEPDTLALGGLGVLWLGWLRGRRLRSRRSGYGQRGPEPSHG